MGEKLDFSLRSLFDLMGNRHTLASRLGDQDDSGECKVSKLLNSFSMIADVAVHTTGAQFSLFAGHPRIRHIEVAIV